MSIKRKSVDFLPVHFRTEANDKFLSGTIDQLIQQPSLKKIDGFIGSRFVKNYTPATDSYLNTVTSVRNQYELEPSIVLRNSVTGQTETTKNYEDILHALSYFGSDTTDQNRLFKQQSYAWNPHIDWDKFINYRNYIWSPNGPATINVTGPEANIVSTIKVKIVTDTAGSYWNFSTDGISYNPTITLYRGLTYIFDVSADDQTFYIKSRRTSGSLDAFPNVTNNGASTGNVIFEVQESTPGTLFYVSGEDTTIFGRFLIRDIIESTQLNVDEEIIGKKNFTFGKGTAITNGMRVTFSGNIIPESYKSKTYIVEGVGESIVLIDVDQQVTIESYGVSIDTNFDLTSFDELPFDSVSNYPLTPDYITINASSIDKNPWSRYNRWVHIDVLTTSAELNGVIADIDFNNRAQRPIIEFKPNIKLHNFGISAKNYVDYLDNSTTDVFSNIEGSIGYYVDGNSLQEGNRVLFLADTDSSVKNKIYTVRYLDISGKLRIHLEEAEDTTPNEEDSVLIIAGNSNKGVTLHFINGEWIKSQVKSTLNQAPLFDVFDQVGISYGDESKYPNTSFVGNKLFSYQIGTGAIDTVLGFQLAYNNIANVGAYLFDMPLFGDTCTYIPNSTQLTLFAKDGFLKVNGSFVNGWTPCNELSKQIILEQYVAIGNETYIDVTCADTATTHDAFTVYKNGKLLTAAEYDISIQPEFGKIYINFAASLAKDDVIDINVEPQHVKLLGGQYEVPSNLTNNPLNSCPNNLSFAEISDHLNTIIANAPSFTALRDTTDLEKYGRRFLQHDGLISLAGLFLTEKEFNIVNALRWSSSEYQKFKIALLQRFNELGSYNLVADALDTILNDLTKDYSTSKPFYFSDMVPFGLNRKIYAYTVKNVDVKSYALGTVVFDNTILSNNAVLVYINNQQLTYGLDYTFDTTNPLVKIIKTLALGDNIEIKVYNNTAGSCMPQSPTKMGLYPAFQPKIYVDDTYITPQTVIQGHDGSITVSYGDKRDELLLELETRIYNNLKVKYDSSIFDINSVLPGRFRNTQHTVSNINETLSEEFLRWVGLYNIDYNTNDNAQYESSFGYNYPEQSDLLGGEIVSGAWRGIYKHFYDTDRPHTHPWEMLGFSEEPTWWESEYGSAPFTSGNGILWRDLEAGYIRQGSRQGYDALYARPLLSKIIPVDSYGTLKDPLSAGIVKDYNPASVYDDWAFGDNGPAENAWRRSGLYPFALQISLALNSPAKYMTLAYDTSRNVRNLANQIVYSEESERLTPYTVKVFGTVENGKTVLATGYHPYIVEYGRQKFSDSPTRIKDLLSRLDINLTYKIGGFTSKDKFKIALETVTSYKTVDNVFVPEENYEIVLNVSTPIKTLAISAVIVERGDTGYIIKGYDKINPYFKVFLPVHQSSDTAITVGGVSESFIYWASNANIVGGTIVTTGNRYFRAITDHITKEVFDASLYYPMPYLPTVGGAEVSVAINYEEQETIVPYGQVFNSIQSVYDFVVGYGKWVTAQGFEFEARSEELQTVANWDLAGKEFLYWSLQRWAVSSVISLSPFSEKLVYTSDKSVVDNIFDSFYEYNLLKSDGNIIEKSKININRDGNKFTITTPGANTDGIFFAKINLVQKEHVVILDNKTVFNDLVYAPTSGYRQRRFKVKGFMTDNWEGDFFVPGFVYDDAKIDDWQISTDYHIGDVVKFQTKYYQATSNVLATDTFNYENWSLLGKKPVAQLLPNFEYKIQQFEDFYSLDNVSFDASQQKFAQKLIGYVPRNYLNSLIPDETSQYKFYQGFIREKGTVQPLEKFSVANNVALGTHLSLQEEWAIRLGSFGAENSYNEVEFMLDQDKFNSDPQIFEFVVDTNTITNSNSYKLLPDDVLTKPANYDGNPWPTLDVSPENGNDYLQYQKLPTAGYARIDDVTFTALYSNNILTLANNASLNEGDTIWVAMDTVGEWDVKRYSLANASIINYGVDNDNQYISFNTDMPHNLSLRDFVSITRLDTPFNGVYEVLSIPSPETFVVKTTLNDLPGPTGVYNGGIYTFKSSRVATKDDIANISGLARWQNCEFVWVDDDGDGTWAVYEKEVSVAPFPVRPYLDTANQAFGSAISAGKYSKNMIISATTLEKGRVYVYSRTSKGIDDLTLVQSYIFEDNLSDLLSSQNSFNDAPITEIKREHGYALDIWENPTLTKCFIVSGAPGTSNAKWKTTGVDDTTELKNLNFAYELSDLLEEGAIKITKFDTTTQLYVKDIVVASPLAQQRARFGHAVKFAGSVSPLLFVSAPGQDASIGEVFLYNLDQNSQWEVYKENGTAYRLRSEITQINPGAEFGWSITATTDAKTVVVTAPGYLTDNTSIHTGAVFVFAKDGATNSYSLAQTIKADDYLKPSDLPLKGTQKTYTTSTVSLSFSADTNSLIRNTGNFLADGYRVGQKVNIAGSLSNDGDYVIVELYALKMTFNSIIGIVNESVEEDLTITGQGTKRNDRFGDTVAMSSDGKTLVVSSDHASTDKFDSGMVYVFTLTSGQFVLEQTIDSPTVQTGELFGSNMSLSEDGGTLLVAAQGASQSLPMAFDTYVSRVVDAQQLYGSEYVLDQTSNLRVNRTTFDSDSTKFISKSTNSGAVYMYTKLNNKFVYGETLNSGDSASYDGYGTGLFTDGITNLVGSPGYDIKKSGVTYSNSGTVVVFDKKSDDLSIKSWTKVRSQDTLIDVDKIRKVVTYNSINSQIIDYYEIFDPIKGKIPSTVANELKYMTPYDPATYTVAVNATNKVRVDNKTTWTDGHVGELWLDIGTLRYTWYEQGSQEFRSNNWGKLFPGATVDVYEWVKSDYRPSEWSQLADTTEGLSLGISGQPKYPDNSVVSVNQYFDPIINDFVNVYFFWVRNKVTLPDLNFRSISAFECSRIIEDPKTQGIKFAAFLNGNAVSLYNSKKTLDANKININIFYDTIETENNRHTQWQLVNENNPYLNIDSSFETKLFDSLVGQDKLGNLVPDPKLSPKLRTGNLFRPRQSWFKNKDSALKTLLTYTNKILLENDIVGKVSLANLEKIDAIPAAYVGKYDEVVDIVDDISSIGANGKVTAQLSAEVVNGRLVNVSIDNEGYGYKIAPTVRIVGDGTGAEVQTSIDQLGKVVGVKIVRQGSGYETAPALQVRPYAVLVNYDASISKWAIYRLDNESRTFKRFISQTYDVTKYWSYTDWRASSFTEGSSVNFVVDFVSELEGADFIEGDRIEVRNPGDGRTIIVQRVADGAGNIYDNYDLIYRKLGTIQFNSALYDKSISGIGFDTVSRYDQMAFDESNAIETRMILEAIKNDIFVLDLAHYWSKFFFVAIRYVLSEQLFVDWVYKTSFVTPLIDAGVLDQKAIYRVNDFTYAEEFIKEIKPFRSKLRDITVQQNSTEKLGLGVTDYDLQAYIDQAGNPAVPTASMIANDYPYKHWYDGHTYGVSNISVTSGGTNYKIAPIVTIVGNGTGATATARIIEGKVSRIEVTNTGTGYTETPQVILTGGGNYNADFVQGTAYAQLGNGKVRKNSIEMKFDRTSEKGLYTGEITSRNFVTDGTTLYYVLAYPVNSADTNYPAFQDESQIVLYLDEAIIPKDNYRITFRDDLSTIIAFNVALPKNKQLRISYIKNTLYTVDSFNQNESGSLKDTFKLTFAPVLDKKKIIIKVTNPKLGSGYDVPVSDYIVRLEQVSGAYKKYVGYIKFNNTPAAGTVVSVQYAKNVNIQNAVDRIINFYNPLPGMPGKDLSQVMKGIEFGGVEVQGLNFSVSAGWDGLPWFGQGWDTYINENQDLIVFGNGTTATYDLGYVPVTNTAINVYFNDVRVDDENFGNVNQTNDNALFTTIYPDGIGSHITLPVVPASGTKISVRTSISDGVIMPSDTSILDTALSGGDFTTYLDASTVRFKTANGIKADEINVDGGEFISKEHSPATEELVKGEMFDALTISVFNSPSSGSNNIITDQFTMNGSTTTFVLDREVGNIAQLDVYIGNVLATYDTDYTITQTATSTTISVISTEYGVPALTEVFNDNVAYRATLADLAVTIPDLQNSIADDQVLLAEKLALLNTAQTDLAYWTNAYFSNPDSLSAKAQYEYYQVVVAGLLDQVSEIGNRIDGNQILLDTAILDKSETETLLDALDFNTIILTAQTIGIGGTDILYKEIFTTTATASDIVTPVKYGDVGSFYLSVSAPGSAVQKVSGRSSRAKVVIPATAGIPIGTTVTVLLFASTVKTYSEKYNQEILITESTSYTLERPPGNIAPLHNMAIVTRNGSRLIPPETEYYDVTQNGQTFILGDNIPYLPRTLSGADVEVYLNGSRLKVVRDYTFDNIANSVTLESGVAQTGDVIAIAVLKDTSYIIVGSTITFKAAANIQAGEKITVTTYTNHDSNLMRREVFQGNSKNEFKVSRPIFNTNNVWVDLNGMPLIPNYDFTLSLDGMYVTISDRFNIRTPNWFTNTEYAEGEFVQQDGKIYICNAIHTSATFADDLATTVTLYGRPTPLWQEVDSDTAGANNWNPLNDRVVITSISDIVSTGSIAYRIFKDMSNSTQYKRISTKDSTTLTKELLVTDLEIEVSDATVFGNIGANPSKPGVLFIAGERIEFFTIKGNVLGRLTRATKGTGLLQTYPVGTRIYSAGDVQSIPYQDGMILQTENAPSNYRFDDTTKSYQVQESVDVWTSVANDFAQYTLTNFNFTAGINYEDQVTVYMGGRLLMKPAKSGNPLIKHDFSITYDSDELNSVGETGDIEYAPDFTITKVGSNYVLTVNPDAMQRDAAGNIIADVQIKVLQKLGKIWYTLGGEVTLQQESTIQGKFLQTYPAELPDKYYYGKQ